MFLAGHSQLSPSLLYTTQLHCGFSSGTNWTANRVPLCCVKSTEIRGSGQNNVPSLCLGHHGGQLRLPHRQSDFIKGESRLHLQTPNSSQHSLLRHDRVWLHLLLSV